jgi:hypothetical protein
MEVAPFAKLSVTTVEIPKSAFEEFVRQSEQLRILKNFIALDDVLIKSQIETVIKAMEEQTNE